MYIRGGICCELGILLEGLPYVPKSNFYEQSDAWLGFYVSPSPHHIHLILIKALREFYDLGCEHEERHPILRYVRTQLQFLQWQLQGQDF